MLDELPLTYGRLILNESTGNYFTVKLSQEVKFKRKKRELCKHVSHRFLITLFRKLSFIQKFGQDQTISSGRLKADIWIKCLYVKTIICYGSIRLSLLRRVN